jgi:hypothetical protein
MGVLPIAYIGFLVMGVTIIEIWKSFIGYKTLPCKIMVSHRKVTQVWFNDYINIKIYGNLFTHEHRTLKCTFISSTFLFAIGHLVEPTNH